MSKFPFMPMFIDAYLADTTHLTAEEHGAYLLLLMAMWRRGGWVPNDDKDLAKFCCCHPKRWPRVKKRLMPMLIKKDGELSQKKLCRVLGGVVKYRQKNGKTDSLKSLDLPPRSDSQKVESLQGVGANKNKGISHPNLITKLKKESFLSALAPSFREGDPIKGCAASGASHGFEDRYAPPHFDADDPRPMLMAELIAGLGHKP